MWLIDSLNMGNQKKKTPPYPLLEKVKNALFWTLIGGIILPPLSPWWSVYMIRSINPMKKVLNKFVLWLIDSPVWETKKKETPPYSYWKKSKMHFFGPSSGEAFCHHFRHYGHYTWFDQSINGEKKVNFLLCDWLIHQYGKPKKKDPPPYSYWKKSKMHFFGPSSGEAFCHHFRHYGHYDELINQSMKKENHSWLIDSERWQRWRRTTMCHKRQRERGTSHTR